MEWCRDCHRQPEKYIRPREKVFDMTWQPPADQEIQRARLIETYQVNTTQLTDCSVCHR